MFFLQSPPVVPQIDNWMTLVYMVIIALIPAITTIVTAYISNKKANAVAKAIVERQDLLHGQMNSMKDALVKTTGEENMAKGLLQGAKDEQERMKKS